MSDILRALDYYPLIDTNVLNLKETVYIFFNKTIFIFFYRLHKFGVTYILYYIIRYLKNIYKNKRVQYRKKKLNKK